MSRKLILHFGFHKTGSSALQIFFSRHRDLLAERGIDYPYPEPDSVLATGGGTGNVVQVLYRQGFFEVYTRANPTADASASPGQVIDVAFWESVRQLVAQSEQSTVLLSGEALCTLPHSKLDQMLEVLLKDAEVTIVAFVRDHFDSMYSSWKHLVRQSGYKFGFDKYVDDFVTVEPVRAFRSFDYIHAHGVPLVLINYDSFKSNLVQAFFKGVGMGEAFGDMNAPRDNPSLTDAQALLLCRVNQIFAGTSLPRTLSRVILSQPAARETSRFYRPDLHERILDRYRPTLEAMNSVIVGGPLALEVRSNPSVEARIGDDEMKAFLGAFKLADGSLPAPGLRAIARRGLSQIRRLAPWARCPIDFDAEAYLFHNADVAAAGVDPRRHYIRTGSSEKRHYRYV